MNKIEKKAKLFTVVGVTLSVIGVLLFEIGFNNLFNCLSNGYEIFHSKNNNMVSTFVSLLIAGAVFFPGLVFLGNGFDEKNKSKKIIED